MIIAARFCAGLFGTQLLCATWLLFIYGADLSAVTTIGFVGSLFTLYCIAGTGRLKPAQVVDGSKPANGALDLARAIWAWSTKFQPRA